MKVLFSIGSVQRVTGGPARSAQGLCAALEAVGVQAHLLSYLPGDKPWIEGVRHFQAAARGGYRGAREATRLALQDREMAVVHSNGLWSPSTHAAAVEARAGQRPLIISPRGTLSPWSLRHKRLKKQIAMWLYQLQDLRAATCFHATAPHEAADIRRLGLRQPIILLPNGIDLAAPLSVALGGNGPPHDATRRRSVLYVGRIHFQKGLRELIEAWAAAGVSGWRLDLVGPDAEGTEAQLAEQAGKLGMKVGRDGCSAGKDVDIRFCGPMEDAQKWQAYAAADLVILPSFSENFGIVVVEGLAAGVPVIATRGTPWQVLEERRCGWWIDLSVASLSTTLRQAMALDDATRQEMGERGRQVVTERFGWPAIAGNMAAAYAWMLGRGSRPHCVITE